MTQTVSHEQFLELVEPTAVALENYANALAAVAKRHSNTATAESPFMAEVAAGQRWANDHWRAPVDDAYSAGYLLCHLGVEHCRAYSAAIRHEPVLVFSPWVIGRAALEVFSLAAWIFELGIEADERIKRGKALRLRDAEQLKRYKRTSIRSKAQDMIDGVRAGAPTSWSISVNSLSVGGVKAISTTEAIRRIIPDDPNGDGSVSAELWSMLSGVSHGYIYALAQSMEPGPNPLGSPVVAAAINANSDTIAVIASSMLTAGVHAGGYRATLMGWDSDTEWQAAIDAARRWVQSLSK